MGFGKDGRGVIIKERSLIVLLTIAQGAAVKLPSLAITDDFRILKTVVTAQVIGLTSSEGQGLLFGMANNDLSAAQIAASISTDGPLNRNDRDLKELAERWAQIHGVSSGEGDSIQRFHGEGNSPVMEFNPRWTFSKGVGWAFFVFNDGAALTTGSSARIVATHYGVWVG